MGVRHVIEWGTAGVVAGELAAASRVPSPPLLVAVAAIVGMAASVVAARRRSGRSACAGATLLGAALGCALVTRALGVPSDACEVARLALPAPARVTGRIVTVPVVEPVQTTFVLAVEAVEREGLAVPACGRVRMRVRGAATDLARGERLRVRTTLRRPRSFANPGGFDVEGLLARRGIHATATIWDAPTIERLEAPPEGALAVVDRWRAAARRIIASVDDHDVGAVLAALVVGDQAGIGRELRQAFTRAGVVHVLSVSGLHVGIVVGAAALAVGWLLARSERVLLVADVRRLALAGSLVPAVAYGALAGFEVATVRSLAMAAAVVAAVWLDRRVRPLRTLALAALAIALAWPGAPAEISYQLSFASVASLLAGSGAVASSDGPRWRRWTVTALHASASAWLGTAPLTALHFHQLSLVGVVMNPIVVPLFGAIVLLPALAGAVLAPAAPTVAWLAFTVAAVPVRWAVMLVDRVGRWPWAAVDVPIPSPVELVLVYVVLAAVRWRSHRAWRLAGVAALMALAVDATWWAQRRMAPGELRATFLDVGQGDAAVVELPDGRVLVVDAGGFAGSDFDTGAAIVEPFLRVGKIQHVDAVVMSHPHPDHVGGVAHLVRAFAPAEVWSAGTPGTGRMWDDIRGALVATGTPLRVLHAGDRIPDYPTIEVLHPPAGWRAPSVNDGSLVLRIAHGTTSVLLAGDVEAAGEQAMLARTTTLAATVLKVPHHGSRTSSTWPFVVRVAPALAVVSVGAENRYGHPAPTVEARYARLLRTDRCGAIAVVSDGRHVAVTAGRGTCDAATPPARP